MNFPAAPAQEQHTRQHHEGSPNKERHHHHHQHIVVQDGVRLRLWGSRGQVLPGLWWARPVDLSFPTPSLTVGRPVVLSHVVVRGAVVAVVAVMAMVAVGCIVR